MAKQKDGDSPSNSKNGLTKTQRQKMKSVRRVGRMAAEMVLTEPNVTDSRIDEAASTHFGTDVRAKVFASTARLLRDEKFAA